MTYPFALYVIATGAPLGRFLTREAAQNAQRHHARLPHPGLTRAPQTVILESSCPNL